MTIRGFIWEVSNRRVSRRSLLKGAAAIGGVAALGPLAAACGSDDTSSSASPSAAAGTPNKGGDLMVGIVGGSAKDTADPHKGSYEPDIAIQYIMYEGLTNWSFDMELENLLAESIEPNADGTVWQVKLRDGVLWHDGKPVTADDVVFSMERIVDPKDPKVAAAALTGVGPGSAKKIDDLTVEFTLTTANVLLDENLAERSAKIVPVGFDPMNPIGSGPFKMVDMQARRAVQVGCLRRLLERRLPYVDTLTMIEFADDTARINALNSGQIEAMSQLPKSQAQVIEATEGLALLNAETGAWRPFTMRIDVKPFSDVRVRQAFRLIVDRQQMIDQAYSGLGALGNDMYGRFDAGTPDLPQRVQDIEQAKSLLKQAGYDNNLTVQLVTSEGALGGDEVAAAQVFAEQAKAAGVTVNIKKTDSGVFYGEDYLTWPFAQDFWATRNVPGADQPGHAAHGALQRDPLGERRVAGAGRGGVQDRRRRGAQRAHQPGPADRVRHGRLHHLVVAQPGRRLLQRYHRLQAGQARRPDRPHVLQGRLLRVRDRTISATGGGRHDPPWRPRRSGRAVRGRAARPASPLAGVRRTTLKGHLCTWTRGRLCRMDSCTDRRDGVPCRRS